MALEETLGICMEPGCGKIRISREPELWLSKEMDEKLYGMYMKKYEGKLSHGYCPEHEEKFKRENKL